jgi:hypothetical protein
MSAHVNQSRDLQSVDCPVCGPPVHPEAAQSCRSNLDIPGRMLYPTPKEQDQPNDDRFTGERRRYLQWSKMNGTQNELPESFPLVIPTTIQGGLR